MRWTDSTSAPRVLVCVSLMLAMTAVMAVTFSKARAAGVIAAGACGAYGQSYDAPNLKIARENALAKCTAAGCKVVAQVKHGCSAYAVDGVNPCGPSGWASGPRLGKVQNEALRACYKAGGKDCIIRTFLCDATG